jgi:hypothetical protein
MRRLSLFFCLAVTITAAPRLEPSWIWRGDGGQKDAYFGVAISANGDFNGDGFADLASGASYYDDGDENEGAVFIYHGTASGLASGPIRTLTPNQAGVFFGASTSVGNVNNDAYDDLIVGSVGSVYIYHGSSIGLPSTPTRILTGDANFGIAISATGDVNGDNFDDLVIGASLNDDTRTDEGAVFLHFGSALGISESATWTLAGGQAFMYFGSVLAIVGDTNGDNRDDLLVGAPGYDAANTDDGAAYLYFGTPTGFANSADWSLTGDAENMGLGGTVSAAGDTNADSFADILIGAPYHDGGNSDEGAAFLYFGSATGPDTANWSDQGAADEAYFGIALAGVGDVNADGFDDIVIGASGVTLGEQDEGAVILYFGSATGPSPTPLWYGQLDNPQAAFGAAISAGDFSNDGIPDIVVGGLYADNSLRDEGSVLIFAGKSAAPQEATSGFGIGVASAYFGVSVTHANVNGDGFQDLIVGASLFADGTTGEGAAFLYLGSATGLSAVADWTYEGEQENAYFGVKVVGAGDVNGDGKEDVLIGASGYDTPTTDAGRAFLFLGTDTGLAATPARTIDGPHASAFLGTNLAAAGDTNGDNKADILIGLPTHDNAVGTDAGSAFLYLGTASGLGAQPAWTGVGPSLGSFYGGTLASAGDTNNDGRDDILVGAAIYSDQTNYNAQANLYRGSIAGLNSTPTWTINATQTNVYYLFQTMGDTNDDGFDDFAISQPQFDVGGNTDAGRVRLYRGASGSISSVPVWTGEGSSANALFGGALGSGDLNRDGHPDLLVAIQGYDNGHIDEGQVALYLGNGSSLATSSVWQAESNQPSSGFGFSVDVADFNGDSYPETIIGAYLYSSIATNEGRIFVYSGLAGAPDFALPQRFNPEQQFAYSGLATASGDFNGDNYPDLAIAAPYEDQGSADEGVVRIFLGSASGFADTASSTIQLDQANAYFGLALASGDIDNDGFADLGVGLPYYELGVESDEGLVALYKGSSTGLAATPAWTKDGGQSDAYFGISLAMLDVNGDDRDDLAVGSSLYDAAGTDNGRVDLFLSTGSLPSSASWSMDGDQDTAYFGVRVAAANVNGDAYDDLLVGASYYDGTLQDEGRVYAFHGSASGLANSANWTRDGGQAEAYFGVTIAGVGDVNGDNFEDVLVGATFYDDGETDEGRAALYFGSATGLANTASWTVGSDQAAAYLGAAVAPAGDTNGDGFDDFLIGSTFYDYGATNDGLTSLFLGGASGPTAGANWFAGGNINSAFFGAAFTSADYDRDGFSDFLVSATGYAFDKVDSGGTFLYHGAPDMDGDGMVDSWELSYGLDPRDPTDGYGDLDNDRLSNIAEHHAGSTPTVVDTDADGVDDYLEVIHGSDPADAADSANLFYVAKWGDDGSGAGSLLAPWGTISHALAAVAASETSPIAFYVANGSYCETIGLGQYESLVGGYSDTFAARTALTAITGDIVLPTGVGIDGFAIYGSIMMGGSSLTACTVSGGGITNSGDSRIAGCLIVGNATGIDNAGGAPTLIHNTFAANTADISGSGPILKNCLFDTPDPGFAYNESGTWSAASSTGTCTTLLTDATASWTENEFFGLLLDHRLILANSATTITVAGEFSVASGAGYEIVNHRLGSQSPAIDAAVMDDDTPDADRDGNLGYDDQAMANIGSGELSYIDIGAFERQIDSARIPPSVRPTSVTGQEDVVFVGDLANIAFGASALTFVELSAPAGGSLNLASNGAFTYAPAADDSGSYSFSYRASDTAANSASATLTIIIEPENDAPVAFADSFTVIENASTTGNLLSNDSDIDSPTLIALTISSPAHGSLTLVSNGSFTYTPTPEFFGDDSFSYQASDGVANSAITLVSLRIFNDAAVGAPVASFQASIISGQTQALGDPYGGDLAATLAAASSAGDQLHIWLNDHFNTYEHGSSNWHILGSTTSPDAGRFSSALGFLVTRAASGTATVTISGSIPTVTSTNIPIAAGSTVLLTYPYPQTIHPARLPWTGAEEGDELRLWNAGTATWSVHTRTAGTWPTLADSATIPIGTSFLYHRAGAGTSLVFQRLY